MQDTRTADTPATLPAFFAWNYIAAFEQSLGSYKANKIMHKQLLVLGIQSKQWQRWIAPYFAQANKGPQKIASYCPLPYELANIPYRMMQKKHDSMIWAMKSIGENLWSGSPRSELPFRQGIGSIIAPAAEERLAQVFRAYRERHGRQPSYSQAIDAGLHLAALEIQRHCGARMRSTRQAGGRSIQIEGCPFCAGAGEECDVFTGITIGMLDWLNLLIDRQHLRHHHASVDTKRSNGHHVWVDVGQ